MKFWKREMGDSQKNTKTLQQDLSQKDRSDAVFMMHLFMKHKCNRPNEATVKTILQKHLGEGDCLYGEDMISFYPKQYTVTIEDREVPVQLLIMNSVKTEDYHVDEIVKSQMWDCPESEAILTKCKYQIIATDMFARDMEHNERAQMLMDYLEALMELFSCCEAVLFQNSGKMFTREKIIKHQIPAKHRFPYFAVNVRYFNIQGTEDMMVDSVGMSVLHLPDLQYHFHAMDPNWVVKHAYNMLTYIFDNDVPIEEGDTVDGVINGDLNSKIQWQCRYEDSLVQPLRPVIDICMGEWASGSRE